VRDMPDKTVVDRAEDTSSTEDDEISLLDLLIVLAKHKRVVAGLPLVAAIVAVIVSLLLPNYYTGTTRILPPQQSASAASALLNQLGGALGGLLGAGGASLGVRNPNDLYVGMLKSRTVADNLISRFKLQEVYDEERLSDARKRLEKETTVVAGRDGIITIDVDDRDPKRAADLASGYVDELMKLTKVLALTEASQRRLFFERQLLQAKDNLTAAEISARKGLQKGGIAQVDAQGRSMIEVTARLRAQISAKEVQLGAMRTFAAEGNPELQRTQQELEALRRELARVEGSSPVGVLPKGDDAGNSGLDNLGRLRDVKYYEFLYELLAKQYELAKIDEAKDSTVVQVMDRAIEPDRKTKPRTPISARLVADLLEAAGIHRVLALDLHAGQIQGFFSVPVDHLFAGPVVMIDYLRKKDLRDPVIVAPDAGGVERARAMAKRFDAGLAIIDKRREGPGQAVAMHLIGDVKGRDAVVIDDIIDTAGTLTQAVTALEREGARRIMACGVHAVLSGPAIDRIAASPIEEVVVTNSIPLSETKRAAARITVLTVAPLLGEAIRRIHDEESVSTLFA